MHGDPAPGGTTLSAYHVDYLDKFLDVYWVNTENNIVRAHYDLDRLAWEFSTVPAPQSSPDVQFAVGVWTAPGGADYARLYYQRADYSILELCNDNDNDMGWYTGATIATAK